MARRPSRPLQKAFVFNFDLVTVVKGTPQAVHDMLRQGIKDAWGGSFWPRVLFEYESVSNYRKWADPPDFFYKISESKNKINFGVYVKRNKGGQHFVWSDFGTGEEGLRGSKYPIVPKQRVGRTTIYGGVRVRYAIPATHTLKFPTPYQPKTAPLGGVKYDTGAPKTWHSVYKVMHPGIRPRHFSQRVILRTVYNPMMAGGFKDATETGWLAGFTKARQAGLIP